MYKIRNEVSHYQNMIRHLVALSGFLAMSKKVTKILLEILVKFFGGMMVFCLAGV